MGRLAVINGPVSDPSLEDELLSVAHEAATAAAAELMSRFGGDGHRVESKSSPTDLVSEADLEAERAVRRVLEARRPQDAILGEEGGATGEGELRWVIDPLDGTTNFLFGVPQFAVSVACEDRDGGLVGVVLDPVRDESFAATRSGAAELNGTAIRGSEGDELGVCPGGDRVWLQRRRARAPGGGAGPGAASGPGYPPRRGGCPRPVLVRLRPLRRLLRAGREAVGSGRGTADRRSRRAHRADPPRAGEDPEGLLVAPAAVAEELLALVLGA